jgi:hypothetical protein
MIEIVRDQADVQGWSTEQDTQQSYEDWESRVRKERPECVAKPAAR